jgi:hypothetical protein
MLVFVSLFVFDPDFIQNLKAEIQCQVENCLDKTTDFGCFLGEKASLYSQ